MKGRRSVFSIAAMALVILGLISMTPAALEGCDEGCSCAYGQSTAYGCWVQYAVDCVVVSCPRGGGGPGKPQPQPTGG